MSDYATLQSTLQGAAPQPAVGLSPPPVVTAKKKTPDPALLAMVEEWFNHCKKNRLQFERAWYTNLAFFFGKQYVQWVTSVSGEYARLHQPGAPNWRVRVVANKIRIYVRKEIAKLTKEKPQAYVIPASSENEDRVAALASEAIFVHISKETKLNKKVRQAVFWCVVTGTGYLKTYWDGKAVDESGVEGKVQVESVSPFHIFVPDVTEEDIDNQQYIIHAMSKPISWVRDNYGSEIAEQLAPDTHSSAGVIESKFLNALGVRESSNKKDQILVKEVWAKPTSKYPQGLYVIWAGDVVLTAMQDGWPYQISNYPFAKLDHVPSGKFYATSVVEDLIPLQKEYNKTRSQIIEAKNKMAVPQLVAPEGSVDARKLTSEPGLLIEYTPGFNPPVPLPLQQMPSYVLEEMERIQRDMDDIASQHEVAKGNVPPGVEAATAISYLQEEDDTVLSTTIASLEEAVEKTGRVSLALVVQFWQVQRAIKVLGADGFHEMQSLWSADVRGNTDLVVQAGSAMPRSRAAKQAWLMEIGKLQWLPPERVMRYLDLGDVEKLHEEMQIDSRQAQRENLQMEQGTLVNVHSWDNHQLHIAEHNHFRKTQRYEMLPDNIKLIFEAHVKNGHMNAIVQEMQNRTTVEGQTGQPTVPMEQQ